MDDILQKVAEINDIVNSVVWGVPMLILIIGTGIYLTVRTGFFHLVNARLIHRKTIGAALSKDSNVKKSGEKTAISQFQALSTALAGTIGTGNIAGVASAIAVGGAGAVFWMWVSAFFGMMTHFSENVLGIYYRRRNDRNEWSGGAMYYIQNGFAQKGGFLKKVGKPLAVIFSLLTVFASFGIGNMSQVNSMANAMNDAFNIPPIVTGIAVAIVVALVTIGGIQRLGQTAEKVVPFMAVAYILASIAVLITNFKMIPTVFCAIFTEAFGVKAFAGGIAGVTVREAMTMGFKRGVFSNEAGLGSSVMVNSASDVKEPVEQGMWGVFEVFFDTIVVCSFTAFTVLSSGVLGTTDANGEIIEGVSLVSLAFSTTFRSFAGKILSIAVLLFAFTTVLGWSFYGSKALEYIAGRKASIAYKVAFIVFIVIGSTMKLELAWNISDTLNGMMAIPNLIGLLVLSNTVVAITRNYVVRKIKKTDIDVEPMLSAYDDIQLEQLAALRAEEAAQKE